MSETIAILTDDTFEANVLQVSSPVLIDFWAPWCGPCKRMLPVIEELAQEYKDKLKIFKMNVDEQPNTAGKFNILSIPTLLLFKAGELVGTQTGALSKSQLSAFIDSHI